MIREVAGALLELGAVVHGGGVVAFALLFRYRHRIVPGTDEGLVRVYRAWGAGNGLSLAAWVYGTLVRWPTTLHPGEGLPQAMGLNFSTAALSEASFGVLTLVTLWVSYVVLEIWTLDPARLLDRDGGITDRDAYTKTVRAVTTHLGFNALLVCVIAVLRGLGGAL